MTEQDDYESPKLEIVGEMVCFEKLSYQKRVDDVEQGVNKLVGLMQEEIERLKALAKATFEEAQRSRAEVAWLNQVNKKLCASTTAEIQRLQGLVKDAYLEGYGQTGAWTRRESSWNDSESKTKL